jgi:hypothetical protein
MNHVANSMVYYSTDGTFTRLEIDSSTGGVGGLPWTMYLPDGGKITHLEPLSGGGVAYQRIYDRNNNRVEIKNVTINGHQAVKIVDEFNREVVLEYDGGGAGIDTITSPAPKSRGGSSYLTLKSRYQMQKLIFLIKSKSTEVLKIWQPRQTRMGNIPFRKSNLENM